MLLQRIALILFFGLMLTAVLPSRSRVMAQDPLPPGDTELDCYPRPMKKTYLPLVVRSNAVSGRVTHNTTAVSGVYLALYSFTNPPQRIRVTQTDSQGYYQFNNLPPLAVGSQGYAVVYENGKNGNLLDERYLAWWEGPRITSLSSGALSGGSFDIADVALVSPQPGATISLPAVFQWTMRTVSGDNYEFDILDSAYKYVFITQPPLGNVSSYTLSSLPSGVTAGQAYWWIVWVYSPDGGHGAGRVMRSFTIGSGPALSRVDRESPLPAWAETRR
jgi:hypothetical protein